MKTYFLFVNDHDPSMNVLADTEEQIKDFIETNFDTTWEGVKHIDDVTSFYEFNLGEGDSDPREPLQHFPKRFKDLTDFFPVSEAQVQLLDEEDDLTLYELAQQYGNGFLTEEALEKCWGSNQ